MSLCDIRNLSKSYPSFVLSDISFKLNAGRIIGFIGRNGAGKTTTIKSVLGFVHPDSGEICYFGLPFSGNEREIKQRIGFSTGAVNYYPKKKIKDIVDVYKRQHHGSSLFRKIYYHSASLLGAETNVGTGGQHISIAGKSKGFLGKREDQFSGNERFRAPPALLRQRFSAGLPAR